MQFQIKSNLLVSVANGTQALNSQHYHLVVVVLMSTVFQLQIFVDAKCDF